MPDPTKVTADNATHLAIPIEDAKRVRSFLGAMQCDNAVPDGTTVADLVIRWRSYLAITISQQPATPPNGADGPTDRAMTAKLEAAPEPDEEADGPPLTHTDG